MDIRLIAVDLDNTLLRSDGSISDYTVQTIARATARGVRTVVCTGRNEAEALAAMQRIGALDYSVLLTGALVQNRKAGTELLHLHLPDSTVARILPIIESYENLFYVLYAGEGCILTPPRYAYVTQRRGISNEYCVALTDSMTLVEDICGYVANHHITGDKFFMISDDGAVIEDICARIADIPGLFLARPFHTGLEIMPEGADKGIALRLLLKHLSLSPSQMMVFGDSQNDEEMFLPECFKIAVANAFSSLKAKADYVTLSNDEDGVAHAIDKFVLNGQGA